MACCSAIENYVIYQAIQGKKVTTGSKQVAIPHVLKFCVKIGAVR